MNECMLIEMMSELDPKYLANYYMEKDMRRGKSFFSLFQRRSKTEGLYLPIKETEKEYGNLIYFPGEGEKGELDRESLRGMEAAKKKINAVYVIISGIAAASLVLFGVVLFIIKRYKRVGMIKRVKTI